MSGLPVLTNIECARQKIRGVIAGSQVSEDARHADNTLEWLLRLEPDASAALQLAALGHDIDRAIEGLKVRRADFDNYDAFKAAHARNSAQILRQILVACDVERQIVDEACRLVRAHEEGGDPDSDLLQDADSISYFDVNVASYFQREGWDETKRRSRWGYRRLTPRAQEIVKRLDQAFPAADTSSFVGSVRCDAVGEGLFTAVALEMDPGNRIFTTLPVVPVPERTDRE